ncbi:unnamed protein product, partial [Meganyctiphanes norvegica]
MQLHQILKAAVAAVNEEDSDKIEVSGGSDCKTVSENAKMQIDTKLLENLPEIGNDNQEENAANFEDTLDLSNVEFDFKVKPSVDINGEDPQNNDLSAPHVSAINNAINTFTQEDFPKLLPSAISQEPLPSDPVEMSFFTLDDENLVITSQQALEMFENNAEEVIGTVQHQNQFVADSKERTFKGPASFTENVYNPKLKYKNMSHSVNQRDNKNIDINALAQEVYQQHCNDLYKRQKQNSKSHRKSKIYMSQDLTNTNEANQNGSTSREVLTTLEPIQYTALAPASFDLSDESVIQSLTPDMLGGPTLDATVDENGQFVVKVVAPGMNMSVPNQYVSPSTQNPKYSTINNNRIIDSSQQPYMKQKNNNIGNSAKFYSGYTNMNNRPQGFLENTKIKNEGSNQDSNFNSQHSQVLMALRESIYKSKAKRKTDDPSLENLIKRPRISNSSINEQEINQKYPINPSNFEKDSVNHPLDSNLNDYMNNYNNQFGYQSLPKYKVQEPYRKHYEPQGKPRKDIKVLDPSEISAALQGRSGGQNPLVFMKPQEIQTGEGEDPLQVQLVYLVYPLENNGNDIQAATTNRNSWTALGQNNEADPTSGNPRAPHKLQEHYQSTQQNSYEDLKSSNTSDYLRIPIREWSFSEVVTFMSKNQENLNIKINFSPLSGITGRELINLHIDELERVAPGHGYQLFRILHEFMKTQDAQMQYARRNIPHMNGMSTPEEYYQQYNPAGGNYYENKTNLGQSYVINPNSEVIMDINQSGNQRTYMPSQFHSNTTSTMECIPKNYYQEFDNSGIMYNFGKQQANIGTHDAIDAFVNQNNNNMFYQEKDDDFSDPDQSDGEDDTLPAAMPLAPVKRGPGRPRKPENELKKKKKKTGRLWEFIRNLLHDPETCPSLVKWESPEEGIFRFVQAEKVAKMWGMRKLNSDMNYEKLSRAMRYYYKGGVFEAVLGRRLVYKFGPNAKGWQPSDPNFPD